MLTGLTISWTVYLERAKMSNVNRYSNWASLLLIKAEPSFGIEHCTDTWGQTHLYPAVYLDPEIKGIRISRSTKGVFLIYVEGRSGERIKILHTDRDKKWVAELAWTYACEIFLGAPFSRFLWNGLSKQRQDDIIRADEKCRRNIERALKVKLDDMKGGIKLKIGMSNLTGICIQLNMEMVIEFDFYA